MKKEREMWFQKISIAPTVGHWKFAEAREGRGQSQKFLLWWGLKCWTGMSRQRETCHIFAHFLLMIENQRGRNLFSIHSGFGKNKFHYLSLWHKITVVQKHSRKTWKYYILMRISSPDPLIDGLFWQESCAISNNNNPFMTDKFCPLLITII